MREAEMPPERLRRRNARLMDLAAGLMWFSMFSYVPILPAYAAELGADAAVIGLIGGVYGLLQIGLRVSLGLWCDRLGRDRLLLLAGFALMAASALMFLAGESLAWIVAARLVAGAAAAFWVVLSAAYTKYQRGDTQVKGQGMLSFAANAGKVLAAAACAVAAQYFGYRSTFVIALITAAAGAAAVLGVRDAPLPAAGCAPPLREQMKLFRKRDLLVFCALALISQMVSFAVPTTFTAVIAEGLGADSMQLGLLQMVYFAVTSVTSLIVATKLYRQMGGIWWLTLTFAAGAVSCVPDFYASLPAIYLMQILSGLCYGVTLAVLAGFVVQAVPPVQRGAATGIFQSLYAVGIFLGPVAAGALFEEVSPQAAYWVFVVLCALCALACPLLIPRCYARMS